MDNKYKKMAIALVIVIIVIVAGIALAIQLQAPSQSASDKMILTVGDFSSPNWELMQTHSTSDSLHNETCSTGSLLKNDTLQIAVDLVVFSGVQDALNYYRNFLSTFLLVYGQNITGPIKVGDAFTMVNRTDSQVCYQLMMLRSNVWVAISVITISPIYSGSWQEYCPVWKFNATVDIATLQLEKIDQYLAQHPGAS
jgi:hypothetical protein